MFSNSEPRILFLGIGNVLMGDEGVGVHVIRHLEKQPLPPDVACLDGGTGGFHLLDEMQRPEQLVLVDATADGAPAGTIQRLHPRFSSDYPPTLCAHDIGLKDLLDSLYLLGTVPKVSLYAVSIALAHRSQYRAFSSDDRHRTEVVDPDSAGTAGIIAGGGSAFFGLESLLTGKDRIIKAPVRGRRYSHLIQVADAQDHLGDHLDIQEQIAQAFELICIMSHIFFTGHAGAE